jgi:hypothetical protein
LFFDPGNHPFRASRAVEHPLVRVPFFLYKREKELSIAIDVLLSPVEVYDQNEDNHDPNKFQWNWVLRSRYRSIPKPDYPHLVFTTYRLVQIGSGKNEHPWTTLIATLENTGGEPAYGVHVALLLPNTNDLVWNGKRNLDLEIPLAGHTSHVFKFHFWQSPGMDMRKFLLYSLYHRGQKRP